MAAWSEGQRRLVREQSTWWERVLRLFNRVCQAVGTSVWDGEWLTLQRLGPPVNLT